METKLCMKIWVVAVAMTAMCVLAAVSGYAYDYNSDSNATYTIGIQGADTLTKSGTGILTLTPTIYSATVSGAAKTASVTDDIYTFTSSGSFTPNTAYNAQILVVAGGGGGGSTSHAAGGGGGGVVYNTGYSVSGATTVTIGAGGGVARNARGSNGGNSVFGSITAIGGGGGGVWSDSLNNNYGSNGGCGGGSTYGGTAGIGSQGYNGGYSPNSNAGGGGGAGGPGQGGGTNPGNGGIGYASTISGSLVRYAGGGGGSTYGYTPGVGADGGGNGAKGYNGGPINATSGAANTGGGGGGGERQGTALGGTGGSGVVIVRYNRNENTYTGGTTLAGGVINFSDGTLGPSGNVAFTGGGLQWAAGNTQDVSSRIKNSTGAVKIDTNSNNVSFASAIDSSNSGGLTKSGAGTLTLSGANTYTGTTRISNGTLALTGSGSIANSSIINVASGASFDTTGLSGGFSLASGQTIKGSGQLTGGLTVGPGSFLSPGNSPGIHTVNGSTETWAGGGTYIWEIANSLGTTPGTDWDLVRLINSAQLNITATSGNKFNLDIRYVGGEPFDPLDTSSPWMMVDDAGGTISGFAPEKFNISVTGFGEGVTAGQFSVESGSIMLKFNGTSVPEPSSMAVSGIAIGLLGLIKKMRRKPETRD